MHCKQPVLSFPVAEHFSCIVKVLFTLLYTQALAALSVKGTEEDRSAKDTYQELVSKKKKRLGSV